MILTATQGRNADQFPDVMAMHVPIGSRVLDMTYGNGNFWRNMSEVYALTTVDWITDCDVKADLTRLPFADSVFDCAIFDPPYMHGGATVKESINKVYRNQNGSHESVIRLYGGGLLEAARVLCKGGKAIVKCQDEIESGQQRLSHVEVITLMELFGFRIADLFVLMQSTQPAMREAYQKTARKNHSYFIVGEFRR